MPPNGPPPGGDMAPISWKALTSSRLASFKDYVVQKDYKATYDALSSRVRGNGDSKQTWDQWARQTLKNPYGSSVDVQHTALGVERVQLFPGWAVRRYKDPSRTDQEGAEFALQVYVSGFASSVRPPEAATRSQKAFYRIAKGYAALPKLIVSGPSNNPRTRNAPERFDVPSDVDLSKLPPTPADITDEKELEALEAHLRDVSTSSSSSSYDSDDEEGSAIQHKIPNTPREIALNGPTADSYGFLGDTQGPRMPDSSIPTSSSAATSQLPASLPEQIVDYAAQKLHANLDARLQPFWSSAIPNRLIRLSIFCPRDGEAPSEAQESMKGQDTDEEPLATHNLLTSPQGSFQTMFSVPWERLATHPPALHVAFGDRDVEYPVVVQAEMWAPPPPSPSLSSSSLSAPYSPHRHDGASHSQPHLPTTSSFGSTSSSQTNHPGSHSPSITNSVTVPLSTPRVPVRLISDIDDTIKHAGVLLGAKTVFHNVFVRHLEELVVHNMVDWYRTLWQRGVRFHYVSNSPFELLPVLNEFFRVSSLPQGSIKLKSYGARSLLPALLSPPASRKRQGVVEVLDAFPDSRFVLIGDTGEQDMELYAELARERPNQIVGVFVRDVTTGSDDPGLMQPGQAQAQPEQMGALNGQYAMPFVNKEPQPLRAMPSRDSLVSMASSTASDSSHAHSISASARSPVTPTAATPRFPGTLPRRQSSSGMTLEERRRSELQARIEHARAEIPRQVAFRVFREPEECVEVAGILERFLEAEGRV